MCKYMRLTAFKAEEKSINELIKSFNQWNFADIFILKSLFE